MRFGAALIVLAGIVYFALSSKVANRANTNVDEVLTNAIETLTARVNTSTSNAETQARSRLTELDALIAVTGAKASNNLAALEAAVVQLHASASNKLAAMDVAVAEYQKRIDGKLADEHRETANRIAARLEEPEVKKTVPEVVSSLATNALRQEIKPKPAGLEARVEASTDKTNDVVTAVQTMQDLQGLIQRASKDDAPAFDELTKIALSPNTPYSKAAFKAVNDIADSLHDEILSRTNSLNIWQGTDKNSTSATLDDFLKRYPELPPEMRFCWADQFYRQERFPKPIRIQQLITALNEDSSLRAREVARSRLVKECGIDYKLMYRDKLSEWWDQNKAGYEQEYQNQQEKKADAQAPTKSDGK